ncbi:MAG TPA: large-conductance mechanosensitive channel protein MscL [Clostridiales bacterium]|nr:large-conductance mechanosensitive channel protein MscL [Clostridiales bacterium]HQP70799.1 large-conductance mechanosensitive channel protein MscL [Clostridiales bacterium]
MSILKEFKEFAMKGNVVDMAVGIIIGGAFGKIITSVVNDIIMPPIGVMVGGVDFKDLVVTLKEAVPASVDAMGTAVAEIPAVTLKYGNFLQVTFDFIIVAFAIFMMVKVMNNLKRKEEAAPAEPAAPPPPTKEEVLLGEIRDLLKK